MTSSSSSSSSSTLTPNKDKFGSYTWLIPGQVRLYKERRNLLGDYAISCEHADFGGVCLPCIRKILDSDKLRAKLAIVRNA
jgi:hypothetical protein